MNDEKKTQHPESKGLPPIPPFKTWEWIRRVTNSRIWTLEKELEIERATLQLAEEKCEEEQKLSHK